MYAAGIDVHAVLGLLKALTVEIWGGCQFRTVRNKDTSG